MKSDDMQSENRRGRPSTGVSPSIGVRIPLEDLTRLDRWRGQQPDLPSRPEAIRRLIEYSLQAAGRAGDDRTDPQRELNGKPS